MRWKMIERQLALALLVLAGGCAQDQPAQSALPAQPFTTVAIASEPEPEPEPEPVPPEEEESVPLVQTESPEDPPSEAVVPTPPRGTQQLASSLPPVALNRIVTPPPSSQSGFGSRVRDERRSRQKPRALALLRVEATGLERLFQRTPLGSPDRPQLMRRLAEAYVELAAASVSSVRREQAARERALQYYTALKTQYPSYTALDDVLYYLALAYERAGALDFARKAYYELIQKAPKSPKIPLAYLAFGELFFEEAKTDPSKWALAQAAHGEVVKYPPPKNRGACFARVRLGQIFEQTGDRPKALAEYQKARQCAQNHRALPESAEVFRAARAPRGQP